MHVARHAPLHAPVPAPLRVIVTTCVLPQLVSSYLADPGFFKVPLPMRLGLAAMPAWLNHITTNAVIDGDGVLVYGQVRPSMRFLVSAIRCLTSF